MEWWVWKTLLQHRSSSSRFDIFSFVTPSYLISSRFFIFASLSALVHDDDHDNDDTAITTTLDYKPSQASVGFTAFALIRLL